MSQAKVSNGQGAGNSVSLPDISVSIPYADEISTSENSQAIAAAFQYKGEAKLRIQMGIYGPGTQVNPKPRYWWMLSESVTVVARNEAAVEYVREKLREFLVSLDGTRL